jgi:hypothetical protein
MMTSLNSQEEISEGLDFILCHLQGPTWPRTVSTATTYGAQVLVFSEQEAAHRFAAANMLDCRINAYPYYTQYKEINRQAPNFIFIDLDRCNFTTENELRLALDKTLKNIRYLGAEPTVLWSGNGYHVYLPFNAFVLEQEEVFANFDQPSKKFLRFAARHLSNDKSDPNYNPSLKSCMVRILGSHNAKRVHNSEVKVIQVWNGHRLPINYLLRDFRRYLIDQKIKDMPRKRQKFCRPIQRGGYIQWIENLLSIAITNYRKLAIWHIFAPYLLNIRGLSPEEAHGIIMKWLKKCDKLRRLDFAPSYKIKWALNSSKSFLPVSCEKLKIENLDFYTLLQENRVF